MKKTTGEKLRELRKERGLTQKQLGDILGVSESFVSYVEKDERNLDIQSLAKVASYFKISFDYLKQSTATARYNSNFRASANDSQDYDSILENFISFAKKKINNNNDDAK